MQEVRCAGGILPDASAPRFTVAIKLIPPPPCESKAYGTVVSTKGVVIRQGNVQHAGGVPEEAFSGPSHGPTVLSQKAVKRTAPGHTAKQCWSLPQMLEVLQGSFPFMTESSPLCEVHSVGRSFAFLVENCHCITKPGGVVEIHSTTLLLQPRCMFICSLSVTETSFLSMQWPHYTG